MKKFLNNLYTFILNLQFIFKPSWRRMHTYYDKDIDNLMIHLIDNYDFTDIGEYKAKLNGVEIWIANRPYACMMPCEKPFTGRPSRLTIQKGIRKLDRQIKENKKSKVQTFIKDSVIVHIHVKEHYNKTST